MSAELAGAVCNFRISEPDNESSSQNPEPRVADFFVDTPLILRHICQRRSGTFHQPCRDQCAICAYRFVALRLNDRPKALYVRSSESKSSECNDVAMVRELLNAIGRWLRIMAASSRVHRYQLFLEIRPHKESWTLADPEYWASKEKRKPCTRDY